MTVLAQVAGVGEVKGKGTWSKGDSRRRTATIANGVDGADLKLVELSLSLLVTWSLRPSLASPPTA